MPPLDPAVKETTYIYQEQLPPLPVPSLESTCKKYLESLRPLQSAKEHTESQRAVKEFLHYQGPDLQAKLREYANAKQNYIEQFWYDSYLNFDNPVVLNLNPFFLLEDDPTPARTHQVDRAASLVMASLAFVRALRREELPPDKLRGNVPLDMHQYARLFGTARIPTENGCHISQDEESKHMVVLCHGQFYWFDVLDDNSDIIMTEKDVSINLRSIIADASEVPIQEAAKAALGILTTENRKTWSGLRYLLSQNPNNEDCLNIVDSALFILCLDYTEPASAEELCMNMLCGTSRVERGIQVGTCMNRWYDKLQIIVCKNGSAGINFEHTGVDGHTVLRFASDVYTDTILRFAKSINGQAPSLWASVSPDPSKRDPKSFGAVHTTPYKLEWALTPELITALRFAETRLADLIGQNEFATLEFSTYGKSFITSMGFSPDAYVQMAFQAAYYGLYGRSECVYEPAMTKAFFHGRTEAIRSVTMDSHEFVRTFWNDNPPETKVAALKKACQEHVRVTKESSQGLGHDRHLYALWCIWQRRLDEDCTEIRPSSSSSASLSIPRFARRSSRSRSPSPTIQPSTSVLRQASAVAAILDDSPQITPDGGRTSRSSGKNFATHPPLPTLFADPGWDKITATILSTSNCGNPSLRLFGFGPTSANGFGIGYIIKDGSISICASSKHRQTARFVERLEAYLLEMRKLLRVAKRGDGSGGLKKTLSELAQQQQQRAEAADAAGDSVKARVMSRGRLVADGLKGPTPLEDNSGILEEEDEYEDGLGGYGFFDAGVLLSFLKSKKDNRDLSEKAMQQRNIGRRLRISEY